MKKIVIYGLAGSGKSTSAGLVQKFFAQKKLDVTVIKLAQPLYELQEQFYKKAGIEISFYNQDQILLESIANHLRRISSSSLVDNFKARIKRTKADVIINDDLRDPHVDYPVLKEEGFIFIRIKCKENFRRERLKQRGDKSTVINSKSTAEIDLIKPDYVVNNDTTNIDDLRKKIFSILEGIE